MHHVVPRLLDLFSTYGVHCTWATVGFLFSQGKAELLDHLPVELPSYLKKEYDPYPYLKEKELEPIYHFAPFLIEQIQKVPGQEIGTHTYSHFYTLEKNTTISQFRADIRKALEVARLYNINIRSIVFPRNQYGDAHIKVCRDLGIKVYRGNESSGFYNPVSRERHGYFRRSIRLLDAYTNVTGHHCHALPARADIINVPASRFLRPYNRMLDFLEPIKFNRIRNSMRHAAEKGLIYHLWWHPHNFGSHMEKNFDFLKKILEEYRHLNEEKGMQALNMGELAERIGI